MEIQKETEQKSVLNALNKMNVLLMVIAVLLGLGLIFDLLIYSSVINLPRYIYDGFNAVYKTIIQMRVY